VAETSDDRAAGPLPAAPELGPVNASWATKPRPRGLAGRLVAWLLGPQLEAQRAFNADQVRLDNAFLKYLEERLAAKERHYDAMLGRTGERLDEVDARHRLLEKELVTHVQDLARRIDLAIAEAGRGRPALEHTLLDLRERVARLEAALPPPAR
jgi:hypothetical protein